MGTAQRKQSPSPQINKKYRRCNSQLFTLARLKNQMEQLVDWVRIQQVEDLMGRAGAQFAERKHVS